MIEIVQSGQAGKTKLLFSMHRLRKKIFADRMKWAVDVDQQGLEIDQFDIPEAVYLLALDHLGQVLGNWRLLPTTGPTMIREVWPEFLQTLPMPCDPFVWEASRFAVDSNRSDIKEGIKQFSQVTGEMFCALTELCLLCGIREVYTLYDARIARLLQRLDCAPYATSAGLKIDNHVTQIGVFRINREILDRLQKSTGIIHHLIDQSDLPPSLALLASRDNRFTLREKEYHNVY